MLVLVTLVLVATATAVGFGVWAALHRWPLLDPSAPSGAVSAVKEEVRDELGFVARRLDPQAATGLGLTVGVVVVIVGGALLAGLAFLVRSWSVLERVDRGAANWGSTNATQFSTSVLRFVTEFGSTVVVVALALVVIAIKIRSPRRGSIIAFLIVLIAGQNLIANLLKVAVDRARPGGHHLAGFSGASFPSGHATTAFAAFAGFALIFGRERPARVQAVYLGAAAGAAAAVGATRVLLDVHWLTDVIAGAALGLAWFAVSAIAFGGRLLQFGAPVVAGRHEAESDHARQARSNAAAETDAQTATGDA